MTALVTPRHHVAPNAIPDALRKIWRECCQGDEDNSVSRALITNLVAVVTADRERTLRALRACTGRSATSCSNRSN